MSVYGGVGVNKDDSGSVNIGVEGGKAPHTVSAAAFADGIKGPGAAVVGTTVGYKHSGGHAASITGEHFRGAGDKIHVAGSTTLLQNNDHQLTANAFTTRNLPSNSPAFSTHGGGVDYQFQDKFKTGASMATTPLFNEREVSLNSSVFLHKTPNSSLSLEANTIRRTGPFSTGKWDKSVNLTFRRDF